MKVPLTAPKTVLETVLEWSQDRPEWQRDALRRIVTNGRLNRADIEALVVLCKESKAGKQRSVAPQPLAGAHLPASPGAGNAVALVAISEVQGVNRLAGGQILRFASNGITLVYGDNGAGKSGYARVLKRACRARHADKIYPDIYAQSNPPRASAKISFTIAGGEQSPAQWQDADTPHPTLSAISVFDSECGAVHLSEENEVAFRPFGLDIPDELAGACQAIREALTMEQKQLSKQRSPVFDKPTWVTTSLAGRTLSTLRHNTDLVALQTLATLTPEEKLRLARLKEGLSKKLATAAAEQALRATNVRRLIDSIEEVGAKTADDRLVAVVNAEIDARSKRHAANIAAKQAFSSEPIQAVGDTAWRALWESARRYSLQVAFPGQGFPQTAATARCVLCQQELSAEARDRLERFEAFVRQDTELAAAKAESLSRELRNDLSTVAISTRGLGANLKEVALQDQVLAGQSRRYFAAARLRRYMALKATPTQDSNYKFPAVPLTPTGGLLSLEQGYKTHAEELRRAANADERKKLESELSGLAERSVLADYLDIAEQEVQRLKEVQFLETCLSDTSTNAITKLGNDIADTVITPKLRDRFQEEIVRLAGDRVRVEIVRSGGRYGSPQYRVRLFAKPEARVEDVLSEGERTCVALAAFLTEVATANHQSAFVFDDPVSSLDHRFRKQVAKRLIQEAAIRQIVVFTHDLVFMYDLLDGAEAANIASMLHTVGRGPAGAGIVTEGLAWKAQRVEDRLDKLEKAARAAKSLHENNDEEAYADRVVDIYDKLRATWERALEDVAFFRVVLRHRDYIDSKHLKKVTALGIADCDIFAAGYKKCCDVVEAHDPSRGRNAAAPIPGEVIQDIQSLKDWVMSLRERQKQIA